MFGGGNAGQDSDTSIPPTRRVFSSIFTRLPRLLEPGGHQSDSDPGHEFSQCAPCHHDGAQPVARDREHSGSGAVLGDRQMEINVNGEHAMTGTPGSYASLHRKWGNNDVISFTLPVGFRVVKYTGWTRRRAMWTATRCCGGNPDGA